jgi:hypothetical protein
MKKILFILLLINSIAFGQARLGSTLTELKLEFKELKYEQEIDIDKDGDNVMSITTDEANIIFYFNSEKICVITVILPNSQGQLNSIVESYNNQYVIVSDTEWKMYSKNGVAKITLIFPDDDGDPFFVWGSN